MTELHHLDAAAVGTTRFVFTDEDRLSLLRRVSAALGAGLLASCLMDTHLHLVAEGPESLLLDQLQIAMRSYARVFNGRHGRASHPLLRGPVQSRRKATTTELARSIRYDHANPTRTRPPIVTDPLAFEWSSARAFAGLTRTRFANVERVRALLGGSFAGVRPARPRLVGLEPAPFPGFSLHEVVAAVGQTYALLASELASELRAADLNVPRGTLVALARLEGFRDAQIAAALGRTRQRVGQLSRLADREGVAIARTLLRTPFLCARLSDHGLSRTENDRAPRR